jgi:hypothetical protein
VRILALDMRCMCRVTVFHIVDLHAVVMEPRKPKTSENTDAVLQWLKNSRARSLRLPCDLCERADVMKVIANNRSIASLNLHEYSVRRNLS